MTDQTAKGSEMFWANLDHPTVRQMSLDHSKCSFSQHIGEWLTAGQGRLDAHGNWEIPCPECAEEAETRYAARLALEAYRDRSLPVTSAKTESEQEVPT
jgi:hypothetical protein